MNVMVFDVPAESAGALSILSDFYNEIIENKDKSINWVFVLSSPTLQDAENIKVLNFPWIKKSWFHRIFFDHLIANRLAAKYRIDKIVSFQNILVPHTKVKQIVYMHNSLPFVEHRFRFNENRLLWIYQNIIGRMIIKSIKKADKTIVQADWIKRACLDKTGVQEDKVIVVPPKVKIAISEYFSPEKESTKTFFYPASGFSYKNHQLIVDACRMLKDKDVNDYKVILTLKGDESSEIAELYNIVTEERLPVEFIGSLDRKDVFAMYSKSILLFPSYIETFGLPLLEARLHKGIVFASDSKFSHEILDGYVNAYFFNPFLKEELYRLMYSVISSEIVYRLSDDDAGAMFDDSSILNHVN